MHKTVWLLAVAMIALSCGTAQAQDPAPDVPCFNNGAQFPRPLESAYNAAHDKYHPHPVYAYSRNGITATRENAWNQQQSQSYPWHGNYRYWKYNTPTAVVLPPTAAFMSTYQWGVGNTQSNPLYHQFQHQSGGGGIEGGGGGFRNTPYWPNSTQQFGLYGVRAPWY